MHSRHLTSRALAAASVLALASGAAAQAPAAIGPTDAALIEVGRQRIPGAVRATDRVALPGGEIALLVAHQPPRAPSRIGYVLLVFAADGQGVVAHDEMDGLDAPGEPVVALSATAAPVEPGAFAATVGMKGADGALRQRMILFRFGGGRLSRLHAFPESRRPPPGGGLPGVAQEVEVLPTSSGGFRDLRLRTRTIECGAARDCVEGLEVSSYTFDGVRYAARPFAIPFVERIVGSSQLVERGGLADRSARAAVDGRLDTGWCEGAKGAGWFEKLELTFLPAQPLKSISITPGVGTGDAFRERTRPKRIRVLLPDGRKVEADLRDEPTAQRIELPLGERVFGVTIVIVDVFKGKREDACIAELDLEVGP